MNENKKTRQLIQRLIKKFSEINKSEFPNVHVFKNPLERGLWVLLVAKNKLGVKGLSSKNIAEILVNEGISVTPASIAHSFARARAEGKVHTYVKDGVKCFQIMKKGEDSLLPVSEKEGVQVLYLAPRKPFSGKKLLVEEVLKKLKGEIKISDPYCGEKTLDIIKGICDRKVKILTTLKNLRKERREGFLRVFRDFKSEFPNVEIRDYPGDELHDRYIISNDSLCVIGHSLKDLGGRESFIIVLSREIGKDIRESVLEVFNRRWKRGSEVV